MAEHWTEDEAIEVAKSGAGVGMPATLKLEQFGRELHEAFGHRAYLVGSALRTRKWRDVDVRLILPDDEFDRLLGPLTKPRCCNVRWNAYCLAFTARGREITGLPIDFQIDRQTQANRDYPQPRSALGILTSIVDPPLDPDSPSPTSGDGG